MNKWIRVRKDNPCPICLKPDWCLIGRDGSAVICTRVMEGSKRNLECGYLHEIGGEPVAVKLPPKPPSPRHDEDWDAMQTVFSGARNCPQIWTCLGLGLEACVRLGAGWSRPDNAWTWPMRDPDKTWGKICGFSLRTVGGRKLAITGSHSGLYIPSDLNEHGPLLMICEGPTDTAAMLGLGFDAIGRPGCNVCRSMVRKFITRHNYANIVIMADRDGPGRLGAKVLADHIVRECQSCKIISPPRTKDARAWVTEGANHATVEATIVSAPEHPIKVSGRPTARTSSEGANVCVKS